MKSRVVKSLITGILSISMVLSSSFGVYAETISENAVDSNAESQVIYEDESGEVVDENAPAVVYEDGTENTDISSENIVYEGESEDTVSDNDIEEFEDEDTVSENEFRELLEEDLEDDLEEDSVSENEIEEESISENEIEETEPIRNIEAETDTADDWFVELAEDYVNGSEDKIVETARLVYDGDEGDLLFPADATFQTDCISTGREYYVLAEGYDNALFYTEPISVGLDEIKINLTDMVGNIAVIEVNGNSFEDQELVTEIDGMVFKVSGEMPQNSRLDVVPLNDEGYSNMVENETGDIPVAMYDVNILYGNDEKYEPSDFGRSVNMTISGIDNVHQGLASVIHITEDGVVEKKSPDVDTMFATDTIDFTMDSFTPVIITATSAMVVEEPSVSISLLNEVNHKIWHMTLSYGGRDAEAFCLNRGRHASTGRTYIQDTVYSEVGNVKKVLDVYFNSSGVLTYTEAQALVWLAQQQPLTAENMTSVLTDVQNSLGEYNADRISAAVTAVSNCTPSGNYYVWKDKDKPSEYQKFVTLLGTVPPPPTFDPSTDANISPVWQIGDSAYAYIDIDSGVLYVTGSGDTWNMTTNSHYATYAEGRGNPGSFVGQRRQWELESPFTAFGTGSRTKYVNFIKSMSVDPTITGFGHHFVAGLTFSGAISIDWENVTFIGEEALKGCDSLLTDDVVIDNLEYIGTGSFDSTNVRRLELNGGYSTICGEIIGYSSNKRISEFVYNIYNANVSNVNWKGEKHTFDGIIRLGSNGGTCVGIGKIGPDVRVIPAKLFYSAHAAEMDLTEARSLKEIGDYAFGSVGEIPEFTLPENVEKIGVYILDNVRGYALNYNAKNLKTMYASGFAGYDPQIVPDKPSDFWDYKSHGFSGGLIYGDILHDYESSYDKYITFNVGENVERLPMFIVPDDTCEINIHSAKVKYIPYHFAYDCPYLAAVNIDSGNNIECIGTAAFCGAKELTDFDFENLTNLVAIGDNAFEKTGLSGDVVIPDTVKAIGQCAFAGASNLTGFDTGKGLFTIGGAVLSGSYGLTDIYYNAANLNRDRGTAESNISAYGRDYIHSYDDCYPLYAPYYYAGSSYKEVIYNAFNYDTRKDRYVGLGAFCIEASSEPLGNFFNAIYRSSDVVVHIGSDVEKIGDYMFAYSNIGEIDFSNADSLEEIGVWGFMASTLSGDLEIPDGVKKIDDGSFSVFPACIPIVDGEYSYSSGHVDSRYGGIPWGEDCDYLISDYYYHIKNAVPTITIPASVEYIGNQAFEGRTGINTINYNAESANYERMHDSNLEIYQRRCHIGYNMGSLEGCELNISNDVEYLPDYLFELTNVTEINWGNGLTEIPRGLFKSCQGLTSVEIPEGVTKLNLDSFNLCMKLSEITIPDSVVEIPEGTSLRTFNLGGNSHTNYPEQHPVIEVTQCDFDVDTDGDGTNDMLRTTLNTENDVAKSHVWSDDYRYIEGLTNDVTVKFVANADTANPADQTVERGEKITEPATPRKAGYEFHGWWTENTAINAVEGEGDLWNFNNPVNESMTLYAWWRQKATVTFNINGATGTTPASITDYIGEEIDLPDDSHFAKKGYKFMGWAETNTGTTAVADPYPIPVGGKTLFAIWKAKPADYEIILPANIKLTPDGEDSSKLSSVIDVGVRIGCLPKPLQVKLSTVADTLKNSDGDALDYDVSSRDFEISADKQIATKTIPIYLEDSGYEEEYEIALESTATAVGYYSGGQITVETLY